MAYARLDKNRDGTLSKQETYALIKRREYAVTEKFLDGVYAAIDVDGNGVLDISEFTQLMKLVRARHADNMSDV